MLTDSVKSLIHEMHSVLFITGAGLSADSGLPTYRGVGGLYESRDTDDGMPVELALSGHTMAARPQVCWKHIRQIANTCHEARPNRAHEIMAAFESELDRVWVLTQNVDGFHRQAGSQKVIEIHGTIRKLRCTKCRWRDEIEDYSTLADVPHCPECHAVIRPDVVLFGEMLSPHNTSRLYQELSRGFGLVFSVGTTSVFPYIAEPIRMACRRRIPTIEINPGESEVSNLVDHRIRERAAPALEAVWQAWQSRPKGAKKRPHWDTLTKSDEMD
ncbi:MAG: NAD-dependent protein deacylase [Proteobacteria bacterium]|nr:NAD-dependent protein deacylase [Pseudomonadota bacterium]